MDYTERYNYLINEIKRHNALYYDMDSPEISDMEYDALMLELREIEENHPQIISSDSPTKTVGGTTQEKFGKVTHKTRQLSLSNVYSHDELRQFDERLRKTVPDITYVCENKFDGLTVVLTYVDGIFTLGATRGDGETGEDVTNNLKTISDIPKVLPKPYTMTVRGEVYMSKASFEELNSERELSGEKLFANPRNAAAGSLRVLDSEITRKRKLSMFAFNLEEIKDVQISSHSQALDLLKELGFRASEYVIAKDAEEAVSFVKMKENSRNSLPYEIDGAVIKADKFSHREILGNTSKSPRWATAYKFTPTIAKTTLREITIQVGRTGVLTPVANFDAVLVGGSMVKRATLHNEDYIISNDIREGDVITVSKAGDVIPKVMGVVFEERKRDFPKFVMPENCPVCGADVIRVENEAAYKCTNENCSARKNNNLTHFVSKDAMNIDGLGKSLLERFISLGYLNDPSDIYTLRDKKDEISSLEGLGEKSVENLLAAIEQSKQNPLSRLVGSLGIPLIGAQAAKILAKNFPEMDLLINATEEEVSSIDGIGEKMAQSVVRYFKNDENLAMIHRLRDAGVNMTEEISHEPLTENPFTGKTFVLTGTLMNYSRDEAGRIIEDFGGKVTSSVSKKTDCVLYGDKAGSKLEKAKTLGIRLMTEEEFIEIIKSI